MIAPFPSRLPPASPRTAFRHASECPGPDRRGRRLRLLLWFVVAFVRAEVPVDPAITPTLNRYEFVAPHMGTLFRIVLFAPGEDEAQAAASAAFARVDALNRIFSDYDPNSEVMRLGRPPCGTAVAISAELFTLLEAGQELATVSGGAFDVTLGPVIRLWREARRARRLPTAATRAAALAASGYHHLRLQRGNHTATLLAPGMQLDLGGIAKGYAADEALAVLRQRGFNRAMVAASGDLALGDAPPGKPGWKIQVDPFGRPSPESWSLVAANAGISTSGDTEQFVEIAGVRYSHIVNPATALGLTTQVAVTVVARRAALSDPLATACRVLADVAAGRIASCLGDSARAIVLRRDADGRQQRTVHGSSPPGLHTPL